MNPRTHRLLGEEIGFTPEHAIQQILEGRFGSTSVRVNMPLYRELDKREKVTEIA